MAFPVLTGAALVAGASYLASTNASNAESNAANQANDTQWAMFQQQQANEKPWLDSGRANLNQLNSEMPDLTRKFSMQDFQQDPGYQFDMQQGMQAIQNSAAAKGLLGSTGTMKDLNNYAQGMASNEYGNAYNRFTQSQQQRYNMLAGLAGTGQTAAGQITSASQNAANNISANQIAVGNASAAQNIATGNTISNFAGQGANAWMNYNMMNKLFPSSSPGMGGMGGMSVPSSNSFTMPQYNYAPASGPALPIAE